MLMPTRLFLVANVMFFAALVGLVVRTRTIWMSATALLLLVSTLRGHARAPIIAAGVALVVWTFMSARKAESMSYAARALLVLAGLFVGTVVFSAALQQVRTAPQAFRAMTDRTNNRVYELASSTQGLLAIGTQCCVYSQLRTRRPLIVEPLALDQIMYAPESGPTMNEVLKAVYGVDLLHPPEALRSAGFDEDLTPVTKPIWESRTPEEWKTLAGAFGFTAVLADSNWTLHLPEVARDSSQVLYSIP
jgi:hypothetical protein